MDRREDRDTFELEKIRAYFHIDGKKLKKTQNSYESDRINEGTKQFRR